MTNVLVCGGREFDNWEVLCQALEQQYILNEDITEDGKVDFTIIEGGAKGADFLARVWAKFRHLPWKEFKADWNKYGKSAGRIRNKQMLDEGKPDLVIAFPGNTGTADMIEQAEKAGVKVMRIKDE